jgi:hypothetical protein
MKQPEKIYNWLDTQLSIARFYGGINFNGVQYVIDEKDPQQPLVRHDVMFPKKGKKRADKKPATPDPLAELFRLTQHETEGEP